MKRILQEVVIGLLYLTPIGYLLSLLSLRTGEKTPGVYVDMPRDMPMTAHIKPNPLFTDRLQWLFNGAFLLVQAFIIFWQQLGDAFGFAYAWIALVFGVISVVSTFSPTFPWNKRFGTIKISILEIVVVLLLVASAVLAFGIFAK